MPKPRERLGSRKLRLGSCIFPGARTGDSAIGAHVGPALDPAGAGKLNPGLSQEAGQQQARNPRSNHTALRLHVGIMNGFYCHHHKGYVNSRLLLHLVPWFAVCF